MVSDSYSGSGLSTVPLEFLEYELMVEWGKSPDEFDTIPDSVVRKILEYRSAKADGESKAQAKS